MTEIIRATKLSQQAGAYYVRIHAMARKHQLTLEEEFDVEIPDEKAEKIKTVGEAVSYIEENAKK